MTVRPPARLPPRIVLVGFEDDFATYVRDWFAEHWPEARVAVGAPGRRVVADLVVVDVAPSAPPQRPTLWLADLDRSRAVIRLGPMLWRAAMPITARRLKLAMLSCLDVSGIDGGRS